MACREPTGRGPGGGAAVPALRPARARLITGLLSLACLGGVVAYAAVTGGRLAPLAEAAGGLGAALLLGGLVLRWPVPITLAVLLAGGAYLVGREGRALVDGWASLVGVGLLVTAELAHWSIGHDARIRSERSLVLRRAATLAALALAALALDFVLLATAALSAASGVLLAAAGVAASVAAVAVVLRLLRPAGAQEPRRAR